MCAHRLQVQSINILKEIGESRSRQGGPKSLNPEGGGKMFKKLVMGVEKCMRFLG
jgi:hypothetical protein